MKDKNGVDIKAGDYLLSKGKFKYLVVEVAGPLLLAKGKNLKHTDRLQNLDLSQIEVIK